MTHHITDHPHIGVCWLTWEITADPEHNLHIDQVRKHNIKLHRDIADLQQNLKIEGIPESQWMIYRWISIALVNLGTLIMMTIIKTREAFSK